MKYLILFLVFIASASGGDLRKIRNDIKEVKLKLYNKELPSVELITNIRKELDTADQKAGLILNKIDLYNRLAAENINMDILLQVMNELSDEFYKAYGEEIYIKITSSGSTQFILFTTTMSCECTIQMCRDYEKALYRILDQTDGSEFVLIDTYSNNSLTNKFNISFVPVLVILERTGIEQARYTREENISEILSNYKSKGGI
jgi:hypothetical protein